MCSALDQSNESYCTCLSTEEFYLEHIQEFLRDLQVITIYPMLVQLGKKWKDWRRCLNKPVQTGWTMIIHESVPTCQILVLCLVSFSSWACLKITSIRWYCAVCLCVSPSQTTILLEPMETLASSITEKIVYYANVPKVDFRPNSWLNVVANNNISLLLCFVHRSTFCVTWQDASFSHHITLPAFSAPTCSTL